MSMSSSDETAFQRDLAALVPNLRAFGRTLVRNPDAADDLVQETLVKAWKNRSSFTTGSNLKAWCFTILRNTFLSERRRRKYEVEDAGGEMAAQLGVKASQTDHMDLLDFSEALAQLPDEQREALILVGAEGFAYEEAAAMCDCAVGTIKSRVNRARARLSELLDPPSEELFGEDGTKPALERSFR